ncbi:Hypothetical Protein FCC1311_015902 [Hondaea fermentalgiana]|uniref:Transmembrane protein n=1 Tax=Hondaea fermentalgiana TaxID=2315210 RepID=A0A2R5G2Z2_9STRA|nr:Hypothetical Protein FCC1311_015902 [Hondaea fermentalgiana]|eukprot:GBG25372.1 Hypothetical Protein FCC1311_015902 [Hondaea fermentalgiana]
MEGGRGPRKSGGTGGFIPLVLLVGAGVGGVQLHRYWKEYQAAREYERDEEDEDAEQGKGSGLFSWFDSGKDKTKEEEVDSGNSSRLFLQELASKGDEQASKILDTEQDNADGSGGADGNAGDGPAFGSDEFRLDVSREGLIRTFTMMLDMKRLQESQEIERIRKLPISRRPLDYEESLRQFRQEKAELKERLKALQKRRF